MKTALAEPLPSVVEPDAAKRSGTLVDRRRAALTLTAAVLGSFVITLDAVIVNVALPTIRDDLGGGIAGLQWVVDGYTLMFAALLLASGAMSDRMGARRAFAIGLAIFVVASLACGLAPNLAALVIARFVQGAAAAVMMPSSVALLGQAYPERVGKARAVALWALGGGVAASAGPVLGGVLTQVSWRWIFIVNVPVGIVALLLLRQASPSPRRNVPFDGLGLIAAVVAMGGLTYGAIEAGVAGFSAPQVLGAIALSTVAAVVFVLAQARRGDPMVPLELFRERNVSVSVVIGFAYVVGFYGLPFVMSLYLQQLRGLDPFQTGLVFLPMMVCGAALTPFAARLAERFGPRALITLGFVLMVLGLTAIALAPASVPIWALAVGMILVGLAGPLAMPPVIAVLLESVPFHRAGTASGVFNTSRQVGGALAVAVFGALLASHGGLLHGLRISLLIAAAIAAVAAVATRLLRPTGSPGRAAPQGAPEPV
jgi:EmrB/QacA subfamily drug resistance transporter